MRRPYSDVVRDGVGRVLINANVFLTVYDTGLPAVCYSASSGGSALTNGQTLTSSNGRFTFWIDDEDYGLMTLFTVTATKDNYATDSRVFAI